MRIHGGDASYSPVKPGKCRTFPYEWTSDYEFFGFRKTRTTRVSCGWFWRGGGGGDEGRREHAGDMSQKRGGNVAKMKFAPGPHGFRLSFSSMKV